MFQRVKGKNFGGKSMTKGGEGEPSMTLWCDCSWRNFNSGGSKQCQFKPGLLVFKVYGCKTFQKSVISYC